MKNFKKKGSKSNKLPHFGEYNKNSFFEHVQNIRRMPILLSANFITIHSA